MQTFLPDPSFERSAQLLDSRRLGKQRVEALQVLRALHLEDYGWATHPAVLMWQGHARALVAYGLAVVDEWRRRGHGDRTRASIAQFAAPGPALPADALPEHELPAWLGHADMHRSHQAALVRKDPTVYRPLFPGVPDDLSYVWPAPPAPRPPEEPFTAWAIRPGSVEGWEGLASRGHLGVPSALIGSSATRKQARQLRRWRDEAGEGDPVAVPLGDTLHLGTITGSPVEAPFGGCSYVVRAVAWYGTAPTSALRRPFQLQDPSTVFKLRGEPALLGP